MILRSTTLLAMIAAVPAAAQAQNAAETPDVLVRLDACRAIASPEERLGCFDREVALLQAARTAREVVVVDRQQLRRTRRTLFGLTLPDLELFGDRGDDRDREAITEIESTIRSVSGGHRRGWLFSLEDGAVWAQTDSRPLAREPRPGTKIRIRRAALGSYLANIAGAPAIRVRRER